MDIHHAHVSEREEFETMEQCRILENWNSPADPDASIARATLDPGTATELHLLDIAERWLVVAGRGRAEIGDTDAMEIEAGDVVVIPPGTPQRVVNVGDVPLVFYCFCTPRFRPHHYSSVDPPRP